MPRTAPRAEPGEYIQTATTGNKISRRSYIYGAANIVLGGKCIVHTGAMIRGDLIRVVRASAEARTASSVVVVTGRYMCMDDGSVLRPPAKTYQGYVAMLTPSVFSYFPMRIGDYVHIGAHSIVEAAQIGSCVDIGARCVVVRVSAHTRAASA